MRTFDDLIDSLKKIESAVSEVRAWDDNDGEESLNSFAESGVGGRRSELLLPLIDEAQIIADRVLEFTQEDRLHRNQARALTDAGFTVYSHDRGYVSVWVYPTDEAHRVAEQNDEPSPDKMLLIICDDAEE